MEDSPGGAADWRGLTSAEAARRLETHGPNALARVRRAPAWLVLARQFTGLLVVILIVAAAIAAVLGEVIDTVAILLVVLLNGILGFVQEWRAETALEALRSLLSLRATVVRDGREQVIDSEAVVPGDLVLLGAGDRVPADLEILSGAALRVDESVLTGESVPVEKDAGDAEPVLYMGTSVVGGRAEGRVTATGAATAFGQVAALTGAVGAKRTQLQVKLGRLARQLGVAAGLVAALVIVVGLLTGRPPVEVVMTGLSLAVAVIPEGLPAVVTTTLALGAAAMARQNALARRLQAVETLGAASVICTDKTGTLTENRMTATEIWMPGGSASVTGTGYDPRGHIEREGRPVRAADDPALAALLDVAQTCSHARLVRRGDDWEMVGEPTEGALVTLAHKGWAEAPGGVVSEVPFSSERKLMSVVARRGAGLVLMAKGAPEQVLAACAALRTPGGDVALGEEEREGVRAAYHALAGRGLRVLALASKAVAEGDTAETGLVLLGLVGLIDPPRAEVPAAIRGARAAGVRVVMITGDAAVTAKAIAAQIGLRVAHVIDGVEVEAMDDAALARVLEGDALFARAAPQHKIRIVEVLQARGETVAMTGDGVNDAPALKRADIGVAMGVRGTDVAKDAADLVLLDDNFATIVAAIREGRRQFENVRKFVRYLLCANTGEAVAIVVNIALGGPLVLLASQILWINLVTDGVTAVALGLEKGTPGQMDRPPRARAAPILDRGAFAAILVFGLYTGAAALGVFYWALPQGEVVARTAAFTGMVVFELASVFAFRSLHVSCTRLGWFSNRVLVVALAAMLGAQMAAIYWPPMQALLRSAPLGWAHWGMIAALALPLLVVPEALKMTRQGPARKEAA